MTTLADLVAAADLLAQQGEDDTAEVILATLAELAAEDVPQTQVDALVDVEWDEHDMGTYFSPVNVCENPF